MQDLDDLALLREYAANNSEAAFAELVSRRVGFVYAAALRQVRDPHLAEEITQAVFIILAQKAGRISDKTIMAGWLFKTTRYAAIAQTRDLAKRQQREQEVFMQSEIQQIAPDPLWEQMSPLLDEALATLGETDRQAVLLRFFENKSLAEVGSHLGTGEDTARKRVARALEKLHRYFNQRGVSSTTAILAGAMSANSVSAAPVALAKSVTAVALAKGAAARGSTLTLIKGALKIMAWTNVKTAVVAGAVVLLAAGTTTVTIKEIQNHKNYPWQINEGGISEIQHHQPPQVRILPSKFHKPAEYTGDDMMIGTGLRAKDVVSAAYGFPTPARAIFSAQIKLPADRYDFIASLPGGAEVNLAALQRILKQKFGVVARTETRETDVMLLKVKKLNALGLRVNRSGNNGNGLIPAPNCFLGWNESMIPFAFTLEYFANVPILEKTSLTNRFDFDLSCTLADLQNQNWDAINQALDQLERFNKSCSRRR
jgi:uncharacterized protein (TIGR03435 family)